MEENKTSVQEETHRSRGKSEDEKSQKAILKEIAKDITDGIPTLKLDLSRNDSVSTNKNKDGRYMSSEGVFTCPSDKPRNIYKDSKNFDGLMLFDNTETGDKLDVYFFCKYTDRPGGAQDSIPFEIEITRRNIELCTAPNFVVFFMLEGTYWTESHLKDACFDNEKTFYINRDNFKEVLTNVLHKFNLI